MFVYKVVGGMFNRTEYYDTLVELISKYKPVGVIDNDFLRDELQGQPILSGLLGAMYDGMKDGKHVIRYEHQSVYDALSQ